MLATVIVLPVLLLAVWLVLQFAIVLHVEHLAQVAAQDAATAAATGGEAAATATALMAAGGGWTSNVGIASATTGREVTVRVTADVIRVFPLGQFHVAASGSAPIEAFIPQPERP